MRYILPWPPSLNHLYRHVGTRVLVSKPARLYRAAVINALQLQPRVQPLDGRLRVRIAVHPPDRRRRDLDNLLKVVLDALQHAGVYLDDGQIDHLTIEREAIVPGGKLVVTVVTIGNHD